MLYKFIFLHLNSWYAFVHILLGFTSCKFVLSKTLYYSCDKIMASSNVYPSLLSCTVVFHHMNDNVCNEMDATYKLLVNVPSCFTINDTCRMLALCCILVELLVFLLHFSNSYSITNYKTH